ncbi:MAG: hypothetical protein CAPSK01_002139 [Candidatus Accumulibacter vicinus]|uniref:Histidine kinase n=1 Tax=Candidatus Accumulibacter vicinus TaxID=2954382 RepID=A0A084Y0P2_9PROT|nr:MAG: hypothetical protein CAPSK01_002139 [Candidatus Accumulibacter vicinus]
MKCSCLDQLLGGSTQVDSVADAGTTFTISLPRVALAVPVAACVPPARNHSCGPCFAADASARGQSIDAIHQGPD